MSERKNDEVSELDIIKKLMMGAILATWPIKHLDGERKGELEDGLTPEEAIDKQWKFILPRINQLIARKEKEAREDQIMQDEMSLLLALDVDESQLIEWRLAQLETLKSKQGE